ncbi:hypothetical protein D3C86_1838680 [compost metagenome]
MPCCRALATSSMPMPRAESAWGSTWARTAYFCAPKTEIWATPLMLERRCASVVWAASSTWERGRVGEWTAR